MMEYRVLIGDDEMARLERQDEAEIWAAHLRDDTVRNGRPVRIEKRTVTEWEAA